jgi:UDP-N-acetylglucosamine--N-acetylmuramyl-(pentapeptide) pyrophosphoryl-undecaprenol N-acetylglucosamine transferase
MAWVNFSGLRGKGLIRKLVLPFNLFIAFWQSARAIMQHRPDVVLGMGGYITFPGGVIAKLLGCPLIIHEQNSVAGLSNRVLSHIANRVLSGFPAVLPQAQWCGNPVRKEIGQLPAPIVRYTARRGKLNVLVVGGSLGAQAINQAMVAALVLLPIESRPNVIHQTGKNNFSSVQALYQRVNVEVDIRPFLDDMARCYADADLVICRAGALTIAELAAVGVASILIPLPHAVDDHQTHNALFLSEQDAAIYLPQSALNAEKMAHFLSELSREKLCEMAQKAYVLAKSDAAEFVANVCTTFSK